MRKNKVHNSFLYLIQICVVLLLLLPSMQWNDNIFQALASKPPPPHYQAYLPPTSSFHSYGYTLAYFTLSTGSIFLGSVMWNTGLFLGIPKLGYWEKEFVVGEYSRNHGGVNTTVIHTRQHKMGQMADFPPLLASSVCD